MKNYPFLLFMSGIGAFIMLMIWLDYRRLGRRRIHAAEAERFAHGAWARWKVDGATVAGAQVTERQSRMGRVKDMLRRNFRLILFCDAGIAVLFTALVVAGILRGNAVDFAYVLNFLKAMFLLMGVFSALLAAVTGVVVFDFLGRRTAATLLGSYDTTPCDIAIARDGVLYSPGGLQRFNYVLRGAEVIAGDVSVLKITTGAMTGAGQYRGYRQQDLYVPIPKGCEAEAQKLAGRLLTGV